ncbi:MAG: SGNH/GDSL hydrolase family protein [Rhodoferax sp.]|uniref:SGNH/GDSL hydrolase family protein n=1 Tax=Rhodoferax sp. TaxID=50421 RepID=UPI0026330245|nr:SGNH/GDSL hydrolase family protein [Rhodoferax sp.]MDD2882183.1 SGNH/GDSL hydrolase family protein [Rhodoferax sp.]
MEPVLRFLLWSIVAISLFLGARTAWLLQKSVELARQSEPLQSSPGQPSKRLLIVGDSTAVGTGASNPRVSVAGLLAQTFPQLLIDNRSQDGATFADLLSQLGDDEHFDVVLVMAGGNDVIRLRTMAALQSDIERVTQRARQRADSVVLMPAGNVGNAPVFLAPVSWFMTWRSRRLHSFMREVSNRKSVLYVNLFHESADDPFVLQPQLNADDGLHPSDAGYRVWFGELMAQAPLRELLSTPSNR